MENASKALIIAGAILLSILIITLGLNVYRQAKDSTGSANLDAQEISTHNSQFDTTYSPGTIKGSQVLSLITTVQQNNEKYDDRKVSISVSGKSDVDPDQITIDFEEEELIATNTNGNDTNTSGDNADYSALRKAIKSSSTYDLSYDYGSGGLLGAVYLKVHSNN